MIRFKLVMASVLAAILFVGGCGYSYFNVQKVHTDFNSVESAKILIDLGFVVDRADASGVVTEWEIYSVLPRNEIVLRIVVDEGVVRGQCAERRNIAAVPRSERFNESHWKFRPCTHSAGLDRIAMAVEGLR